MDTVITQITGKDYKVPVQLRKKYCVPGLAEAKDYPVDYSLHQGNEPGLFLFGIPSPEKAHLVAIILHYFARQQFETPAMLIFDDQKEIPRANLSRLRIANAGGPQAKLLSEVDGIEQDIRAYLH